MHPKLNWNDLMTFSPTQKCHADVLREPEKLGLDLTKIFGLYDCISVASAWRGELPKLENWSSSSITTMNRE